jgi:hypothetical protein
MEKLIKNVLEDFGSEVSENEESFESNHSTHPEDAEEGPSIEVVEDKNQKDEMISQYSQFGECLMPSGKTLKKLKPGAYAFTRHQNGLPLFYPVKVRSDEWLDFRDSIVTDVHDEITRFWKRKSAFKKYGFLQRRGYMFYGPAGTGKTVLVKQLMTRLIKDKAVVFLCNDRPSLIVDALRMFSTIEPNRNVICVFEDLDAIIERWGDSEILALLDGEDSIDQVLNIATTNYPEKLDKRIVGRPRRFDRIIKIGFPDENMRKAYFKHKLLNAKDKKIDEWVSLTEEFTFAAMTELVISVECLGNDLSTSVKRIKELLETKACSSDYKNEKVGFAA